MGNSPLVPAGKGKKPGPQKNTSPLYLVKKRRFIPYNMVYIHFFPTFAAH